MKVKIKITETLSRTITIDSLSVEDAILTAENMYKNEEIILDYTDFNGEVVIETQENNLKNKKDLLIAKVIKYLIKDEENHYNELNKPQKHIYLTLLELQKYIK